MLGTFGEIGPSTILILPEQHSKHYWSDHRSTDKFIETNYISLSKEM